MKQQIRVLLVEDQDITAQMIRIYLQSAPEILLVETVKNALLAPVHCAQEGVDLVLMDVYTEQGADGLEAAGIIKKEFPKTRIIAITAMPEADYIRRARENGVDSFWYKEASAEELVGIIRRTLAGESVYPTSTMSVLIGRIMSSDLTEREVKILRGLVRGDGNAEIAAECFISVNTVKAHIRSMLDKTGCRSRTELAVRAREAGFIVTEN